MFCPSCGNEIDEKDKFCRECGWKVVSAVRDSINATEMRPATRQDSNRTDKIQEKHEPQRNGIPPQKEINPDKVSNKKIILIIAASIGALIVLSCLASSIESRKKEIIENAQNAQIAKVEPEKVDTSSAENPVTNESDDKSGTTDSDATTGDTGLPREIKGLLTEQVIDELASRDVLFITPEELKNFSEYISERYFFTTIVVDHASESSNCVYDEKYGSYNCLESAGPVSEEWKDKKLAIYGCIGEYGYEQCEVYSTDENEINAANFHIKSQGYSQDLAQLVYDDIAEKAQAFKEECVSVSWDDLRRNPDSYKGDKIRVKVTFIQVDADGWIFQGTQVAKMDGKKDHIIAISDNRIVRSPRFVEGDTITLYGYGDGLGKFKTAGAGGKIKDFWTGDSGEELPDIDVQYTEKDDYHDWIKAIESGNTDYHIAR